MSKASSTRACDDGLAEWRAERAWVAEANRLYGERGYGIVSFDHGDYRRAGDVTPQEYVAQVTQDRRDADYLDDIGWRDGPDDYGFDDFCHRCGDPYCAGECRWWPPLTEDDYDRDFRECDPLRSLGIPERLLTDGTSNYGSAKADADRWSGKS